MTTRPSDFTPIIDLVAEPGTGPVRERRPVYVDLLPPCNHACPAGENIQAWLAHAQAGRYREAWLTLVADNPMPAVHGRVCYHPCETSCNRQQIDSAVRIHAVERFLGDQAAKEGWPLPIDGAAVRQARAGRRRRPERPFGRLSPGAARARGRDPRRRSAARRHDAFRHSRLSPAARGPHEGGAADRGDGRQDRPQSQGRGPARRKGGRCVSTRCSSPSARMSRSMSTSRRAMRPACSMP